MKPGAVRFDLLFDADEYRRSGFVPWTFFAYPTSLAVEHGLPPDDDVCKLLAEIQRRGIDASIWVNGIADDTTYFACRKDDIERLRDALEELEDLGEIEMDFLRMRSDRLFAQVAEGGRTDE